MRPRTISLELFGDRFPWEGKDQSAGDSAEFMERVKTILPQIIENELTERQRFVLEQYFYGNKTEAEIAAMRGCNKSTVCRHLCRAKQKIKKAMQYGYFPVYKE